jgi:metacaspase-1
MSTLRSLHFGVNKVDPSHYGTDAPLRGCENDARAMQALAANVGYEASLFLTKSATSKSLFGALEQAAAELTSGDVLMLTLACHGSQIVDQTGDEDGNKEDDGKDETWCLYDRMVIDDEVYAALRKLNDGVIVYVVSDSCHSGTSTRQLMALVANSRDIAALVGTDEAPRFRCINPFLDPAFFEKHSEEYRAIKAAAINGETVSRSGLRAMRNGPNVVLFSGCQDSQTSADGSSNGVFTKNLLDVWSNGSFSGSCDSFRKAIEDTMKSQFQIPNLFPYGPSVADVVARRPFYPPGALSSNPVKKRPQNSSAASAERPSIFKNEMENSMWHPAVMDMMQASRGMRSAIGDSDQRVFDGGCVINFHRSILDGKSDKEVMAFFTDVVAPEICSNYFVARDSFNGNSRAGAQRGWEVSCTASTGSRDGSVSCTGTWKF